MEENDVIRQGSTARDRLDEHAAKRRDADAARKQDRRSIGTMEPKVSERALGLDLSAQRNLLQHALEGRVAEAGSYLKEVLTGSARDREGTHIAFGVRLGGIEQRHIDRLRSEEHKSE